MRRIALIGLLVVAGCGSANRERVEHGPPVEPTPRFTRATERPAAAPRPNGRYLTAQIERRALLRKRPRGRILHILTRRTEFGSPQVLSVLRRRDGWLQVVSAQMPNHRPAWIPERRASLRGTDFDIVVDRSERKATLRRDGRALRSFPVAVGRPGNETPLGRFAVTDKLKPTDPTSPYGCCAIALSGHQTLLEPGWPGGDRLAIHGTPQPETIGKPISLGCLRAPEAALKALLRRVPLGAPVFIRA